MKLNQKPIGFALLLLITLLSTNIRSTQLSDRAIVEALGVDYSNSLYTVTAQVYNPTSSETAKSQTKILTGSGENIEKAIDDINRKNSKTLYLSHNSFIAIGLECASFSLEDVLNFFQNDSQPRPDILMVLTDKAENLIKFTNDENTTAAKSVAQILKNNAQKGTLCDMRLYEILRHKETPTSDYMIPVITNDETTIKTQGVLVFKQNSPVVLIDEDETIGYNFIKSNVKDLILSVDDQAVEIKNSHSRVEAKIINDEIEFNVNIEIDAAVNEGNPQELTELLEKEVKEKSQSAVQTALFENGCDIFEFGKLLRTTHPSFLKRYKNWSNDQKITVLVSVECHIE